MKEEIKEINIPENVLVALGDLTNGALNYYKATETIKVRHNTILDYITNLQKENEELRRFRYTIRKDETKTPPTITRTYKREYDELQQKIKAADKMLSEFNTKLMEILKIGISIKDISDIQKILRGDK